VLLQQVQAAESAASSSGGWQTPRSEASTSVAGTPHTPWQEEAALQVRSATCPFVMIITIMIITTTTIMIITIIMLILIISHNS